MKKVLIFLNIISLFLTSCGSFQTASTARTPANDSSCHDLMKSFFTPKIAAVDNLQNILKIELSKMEVDDFFIFFRNSEISEKDAETVRAIYLYTRDNQTLRVSLLKEFRKTTFGEVPLASNKNWAKFVSHQKRVETHAKKFWKKDPTNAKEKIATFEKLYYGCKAQMKAKPTPADIRQGMRLTYALTVGGAASTAVSYLAVTWEDDKDARWFNELFFAVSMDIIQGYLTGKYVLANPNLSPWKGRLPLNLLSNAGLDAGISGVYGYLFGTSNDEMEEKLKELKKDPHAQEKFQELLKIAEENGLYEKYAKEVERLYVDKKTGKPIKDGTIDDIDLEESRELFMAALAEQEYQVLTGPLETGYRATDRYAYHRLFNLANVPAGIAVALLMTDQMCMTPNPQKGFAKAATTYMITSLIFDVLYFKGRRDLINQ